MTVLNYLFFIMLAGLIGLLSYAATRGPVTHLISCNGQESEFIPGEVEKIDSGKHLKYKNVWGKEIIKPTKTCQAYKFETDGAGHDVD